MTSKTSVKPADRLSALKARQSLKMARSAHAYVRGSTAKFYQWLEEQKRGIEVALVELRKIHAKLLADTVEPRAMTG